VADIGFSDGRSDRDRNSALRSSAELISPDGYHKKEAARTTIRIDPARLLGVRPGSGSVKQLSTLQVHVY